MKKSKFLQYTLRFLLVLMVLGSHFCKTGESENNNQVNNICGQEPCYEGPFEPPWVSGLEFYDQHGVRMSHDNRVLETDNFLTFSDASSDQVKIDYAAMAENSIAYLKNLFSIPSSAELGIVNRDSKITIYSNRYKNHNQSAFYYGFILYAKDKPGTPSDDPDWLAWYQREITHETMHVVQFFLGGHYQYTHTWFIEGIAEHVSGGASPQITSWQEVLDWRSHPDHYKNPISIRLWQDFPVPDARVGEYYRMFGLAVRYLLSDKGLGRSYMDVKQMFQNLDHDFDSAFHTYIGITVDTYEEHFYEWIYTFFQRLEEE